MYKKLTSFFMIIAVCVLVFCSACSKTTSPSDSASLSSNEITALKKVTKMPK